MNGSPSVSWTVDPPAASAIVSVGGTYDGDSCHVMASAHTFTMFPMASTLAVGVTTFVAPRELDTAFGHVSIYRAGAAGTTLMPP